MQKWGRSPMGGGAHQWIRCFGRVLLPGASPVTDSCAHHVWTARMSARKASFRRQPTVKQHGSHGACQTSDGCDAISGSREAVFAGFLSSTHPALTLAYVCSTEMWTLQECLVPQYCASVHLCAASPAARRSIPPAWDNGKETNKPQ